MEKKYFEVKNYYRDVLHLEQKKPDNPFQLIHPCNCLIVGGSGSGKTNLVPTLYNHLGGFDKVLLFTGTTPEEAIYEDMHKKLGEQFEAYTGFQEFYKKMKEIKNDKRMEEWKMLVICDDFLMCRPGLLNDIVAFSTWARKITKVGGCTFLCLTQDYFGIPKTLRLNINYFCLMRDIDTKEIKSICHRFNVGQGTTLDDIIRMYHDSTKAGQPEDFFLIDKKTRHVNMKLRKQFVPFVLDENEQTQF